VSKSLGVPIAVHRIGPNTAIRDIDAKWAALTGLSSDSALLVRPDDFVGWRAQTLPAAPERELRKVLSRILAAS
jgi:putative polyketide hydroxylase